MERKETPVAVALKYEPNKDNAPHVVAAGSGHVAEKIIELGKKSQVPLYSDPVVAEMLTKIDIGAEIPPELYQVIAEVLVFVHGLSTKVPEKLKNK